MIQQNCHREFVRREAREGGREEGVGALFTCICIDCGSGGDKERGEGWGGAEQSPGPLSCCCVRWDGRVRLPGMTLPGTVHP